MLCSLLSVVRKSLFGMEHICLILRVVSVLVSTCLLRCTTVFSACDCCVSPGCLLCGGNFVVRVWLLVPYVWFSFSLSVDYGVVET